MSPTPNRHLPVQGTFNVRDLGGYATPVGETRWRRFLRADGLHRITADGIAALRAEGVTTVIDLRHTGELVSQPNPFATAELDDVEYHNISLFDDLAPRAMEQGDVLLALYINALANRQAALRQILTTIAAAPDGTVLFHCTAGKDRTGIVAALLLGLAGVETADIVADYASTGVLIAPMIEQIVADAMARGVDPEQFRPLLASSPATMLATIDHIATQHGSVRQYLLSIGLTEAVLERLHTRLTGEE